MNSSITLTLTGNAPTITTNIFPPIELNASKEWEIGLISLVTYNTIPNIDSKINDMLYFGNVHSNVHKEPDPRGVIVSHSTPPSGARSAEDYSDEELQILKMDKDSSALSVRLPQGAYELLDIEKYVTRTLKRSGIKMDFYLKANNNTLHSELFCSRPVDFTRLRNIGPMLGFSPRVLEPNAWHISDSVVNIISINVINVLCNLVTGSYNNTKEEHIIHQFTLQVDPGYRITEIPTNVIYLSLNTARIESISLQLVDQEGRLINFQDEPVTIRLHLRQKNGVGN